MSLAIRLIKCCTRPRVLDSEELDYSHSNLLEIPPDVFSRAKSLVALSLNANAIRNIPSEFFTLYKLTHLDMSDNDIEKFSDLIKNFVHLKALDLSKNALTTLPNTIHQCAYLEALELSVNPLGRIPEHLTQLHCLQELYINDVYLDILPETIGRLSSLLILEARDNHLTDLPRSLISLTLLKRLDIGNNQLTCLSPVIGHLTSLEELWADSNNLKSLPRDICYLSNLKFLELSKNRLECLPEEIDGWTSLTDLHLSDNYLQTLPNTLCTLNNMNNLQVNNNHLTYLPNGIGRLRYLEELSVADNKIQEIPFSIGSLKHLFNFNIDSNDLIEVTSEISGCLSLSILSVRNNYLHTLPREISFLSNLVVVNISGNRLQYMPFTLTRLKKLLALWIIENQTRPLLEMEPKELENGEKVLTCFLFPQGTPRDMEETYSRGKLSSDNDSFATDAYSELPHNSSIVFDVVESSSRLENYPKDIYTRQQPKRFSRNSESPYATLPNSTPDSERFPSRAYYACKYGKIQSADCKPTNNQSHAYSHTSQDSQSNPSNDRHKSDTIGYHSSVTSCCSNKFVADTDHSSMPTLPRGYETNVCSCSKHSCCQAEMPHCCHFTPHRTQLSSCDTYCGEERRFNSVPSPNYGPYRAGQHDNPIANQSKIYEATVEFGRDYLDGNVSPCKPLPMPHSVDAYYSDIGMNMQGGYEKLLKEMNIPSDPSSIQALLQLSAHIANQNLAHKHSSHSNNRYLGDPGHYSDGGSTKHSHSTYHLNATSGHSRNKVSHSTEKLDHYTCPSPLYNIPAAVPRYSPNYHSPNEYLVPDCTVSHSITPNTEISSMADGITADSGISSVKTDTYQPPVLYLHNNNNNNDDCLPTRFSTQSLGSNNSEVYQVNLTKQPNLELCFLEKENEENQKGLFISHVHSDDPSGSQGDIRCGDRILEINGLSLENTSKDEAMELIKLAIGTIELKLKKEQLTTLL